MFAGANLPAYAADDASSPAHRQMYGYFNTNGTWGGSYGFASFNLDKLDSPELIYPYGDQISIYVPGLRLTMFSMPTSTSMILIRGRSTAISYRMT